MKPWPVRKGVVEIGLEGLLAVRGSGLAVELAARNLRVGGPVVPGAQGHAGLFQGLAVALE